MHEIHDGWEAETDLNLVVAFNALAREGSVTRAAHRLGLTQSAMSHALRRLRDLLGDPLLVRGKSGMVLTPRAEAMVVPLRSGLVTIGRALAQPPRFDPLSARRAFTIATLDLFDVLMIPPLLARIREEAPGVDITVVPLSQRTISEQLETGEVDAAVMPQVVGRDTWQPAPLALGILRRTLFRDNFVCLLRADHPQAARKRLTLKSYAALSHVLVSPSGEGPGLVDQILAEHGLTRRIALRLPHFHSALAVVAKSDLILTAPTPLALLAAQLPVKSLKPPLALPDHTVNLVWHERFSHDPGHEWLRELVADVAKP
jgi:DNA-binding transcriptional LysR family regulator